VAKKKAVGQRGSWFATVDGIELPCAHRRWAKKNWPHYHDPFKPTENGPSASKILKYVQAIKDEKQVILTNDDEHLDDEGELTGFTRLNYIAIYGVENVSFDPDAGLKFTITKRLFELR